MTHTIPTYSYVSDTNALVRILPLQEKTDYDTRAPHRHDYFEIFLMHEEGDGVHEIDFLKHPIPTYSVQFLNPGQVHHIKRSLNKSIGSVILFNMEFLMGDQQLASLYKQFSMFRGVNKKPVLELDYETYRSFKQVVSHMYDELKNPSRLTQNILASYLYVILAKCYLLFEGNEVSVSARKNQLNEFIDLLEENFTKIRQVAYYADQLNIGTKKLSRICKNGLGLTPNEIIRHRILVEVKRLLHYTDKSIKEISIDLQFNDSSHLNKFFKLHEGQSLSEFRKQKVSDLPSKMKIGIQE